MSHTPTPWKKHDRRNIDQGILITDAEGKVGICRVIGESQAPRKEAKQICLDNADRIIACVEFCAGTDSDFLTGNLGKMLSGTGIAELTAQRDRLLAACKVVCDMLPGEHACDPMFWPVVKQCRAAIRACENTPGIPE